MRGLDPRINHVRKIYAKPMDPRVKPAGDGGGWTSTDSNRPGTAIAASARQPPPLAGTTRKRNHLRAALVCFIGHTVDGSGRMQFDDSKSGNHLETQPGQPPAVVANIPERQGVTGHNVRYMLFFGIGAAVIALAAILVSYLA